MGNLGVAQKVVAMTGPVDLSLEDKVSNSLARLAKAMPELTSIENLVKELGAGKAEAEANAHEWERKCKEAEAKFHGLKAYHIELASQNWELDHKTKYQSRKIEMLESTLQNSIPLADWDNPPRKMRTALELHQEQMIRELQRKILSLEKANSSYMYDEKDDSIDDWSWVPTWHELGSSCPPGQGQR
ncbi:hypothetical protein GGS20DRAFT_539054 [Poronia punctata]|nr:hypothetical protein GGS20DRAFT_539054 [Poronia punctata]